MKEEMVGEVVKFFAKPVVAAIKITVGQLKLGDIVRFKGHTTDFQDEIKSMQIDNTPIEKAEAGQLVGIKVKDRVRENDSVFKLTE
jgi:translation elongation factor EF-1alpha